MKKDPNAHKSERPEERQISPAVGIENNKEQLSRREAIADSAEANRKDDLTPIGDDVEVEVKPPEAEEITETTPVTEPTEVIEEPRKFKVPVNGKMIELTEEELIARAAKVSSADEYLKAASESVKTAASVNLSPQDEKPIDRKALVRAIQMGTEEEAEQALGQLIETLQPPKTPDVAEVVEERLTLRDAKAKFEEEFKDLLSDKYLKQLVWDRDSQMSQTDKDTPYQERWRKAATEVREWAKGFKALPTDKAARKALVAPIPTAAGRPAPVQDEEGEDSVEATIASIAKARGQARPISH